MLQLTKVTGIYRWLVTIILFSLVLEEPLHSQCECNDCPFTIAPEGSSTSTLTVSGAVSNTLGVSGQRLKAIHLDFFHNGIAEIELILEAPDGSQIELIQQNFIAQFNRDNNFSICFVDCGEPVAPYPGTSSFFDTEDFDVIGESYSGTYYPSDPTVCLSDLTGSVNGTWSLIWDDFLILMGGTLFSWTLEFEDNTGTNCGVTCAEASCLAEGGSIGPIDDSYCQGAPELNLFIPIDFNGVEPDPNLYGYTFVITDENDIIIDYLDDPDLTGFDIGEYNICGLSYLLSDIGDLPVSNGSSTLADIQSGIDLESFCADLSDNCLTITIDPLPEAPQLSGPLEVCVNEPVIYTVDNFDPDTELNVTLNQGSVSQFLIEDNQIFLTFLSGPGEICVEIESDCGASEPTCITINVIGEGESIQIVGPELVCESEESTYIIDPPLEPGETYDINVVGGIITSQVDNIITVQWDDDGEKSLTVGIIGSGCPIQAQTIFVEFLFIDFPTELNAPDEVCIGENFTVIVPFDPNILIYNWTGTGLSIPPGANSNSVNTVATEGDIAELCLEVETACGTLGPLCESIIVNEPPNPSINGPGEVCVDEVVTFTLEGITEEEWTNNSFIGPFNSIEFDFPVFTVAFGSGPPNEGSICANYQTVCGSGQICIDVNITQSTSIDISGPLEVCSGIAYTYQVSPPISPGSSLEIDIEGGTLMSQDNSQFEVEWTDTGGSGGNTATLTIIDSQCGEQTPIVLEVDVIEVEPPMITFNPEVCVGGTGTASVPLDPNVVNYNWLGTGITILSGQGSSGPVEFLADQVGTAELCVELESVCGLLDPVCVPILITEGPMPNIENVAPSCDFNFLLNVQIGPTSDGFWNQVSGPSVATIFDPTNTQTNVEVFEPGLYTFEFIEDNGNCQGVSSVEVEIFETPEVFESDVFCFGGEYQVELIIAGGSAPYFVDGEEIIGDEFTSPSFPSNTPYEFTVSDANGCSTLITGFISCPCIAEAGTMSDELLEVCISGGESIESDFNNDAVFDLNDIGAYVLHDSPTNELGTIIEINDTGIFDFQPGIIPGEIYYVSYIVGEEVDGNVNLSDPCLSVAIGQPVIFYDDPDLEPIAADPFCGEGVLESIVSNDVSSVTWGFIDGPGTANIFDPTGLSTAVSFSGPGIYIFSLTAFNQACSATEEITVMNVESISLSNIVLECENLESYTASFQINSAGESYTIDLPGTLTGNQFISESLDANVPSEFIIIDENGCLETFSLGPIDCECEKSAGTMDESTLTACADAGESVQAQYNEDGILLTDDIGVFILHDNPNNELGDIISINDNGEFIFLPGMVLGQTYFISYVVGLELDGTVDFDDPCLQVSFGQPVIFYGNPDFELLVDDTICGLTAELAASSTDMNFEVFWSLTDGPSGSLPDINSPQDNPTLIEVNEVGNYTFQLEASNLACTVLESFSIDFLGQPIIDMIETECASSQLFTATISFIGDTENLTVSLPGTFIEDRFVSALLDTEMAIDFTITDSNGCITTASIDPVDCDCLSEPGTMGADTLFLCETGGNIELDFENDGQLGPLDTSLFVIHTLDGSNLGDPVFFTDQTIFQLPPGLETEVTYYISNMVTGIDPTGEPDLLSSCLRISVGQPLYIYSLPVFELPADTSLCFTSLVLNLPSSNTGVWSVTEESTDTEIDYQPGEATLSVFPQMTGNVSLEYTQTNGLCELADTLNIVFWELPALNSMTECFGEDFVANLEISGGLAPYQLNGEELPTNIFVSDTVPSETILNFSVIDDRGCLDEVSVTENCDCESESGFLVSDDITLCEGQDVDLSAIGLTGSNIPEGYDLFYFLLNAPNFTPDNVILQNEGDLIPWTTDIQTEQSYFIAAVVAPLDGSQPDLEDVCISVSNTIPVIWLSSPMVDIEGSVETCLGEEVNIIIASTGTLPFDLTLASTSGQEITVTIESDVQLVNYTPIISGADEWEVINIDTECPANINGRFIVNVVEPLAIDFPSDIEVCNNSLFGSLIDLNNFLDSAEDGIWIFDGSEVENGLIDVDGFDPGMYTFEFSTEGFEDPCPGNDFTLNIEVNECQCPTIDLPSSVDLCAGDTTLELNNLFDIVLPGQWSIENISGDGGMPRLTEGILTLDETTFGVFLVNYSLQGDFPDDCPLDWSFILNAEQPPQSGIPLSDIAFCPREDELVNLENYLTDADNTGIWSNEFGEVINPTFSSTNLEEGANIFFYLVSGDLCPDAQSEVFIFMSEDLEYTILSNPPLCPDINDGSIAVSIENSTTEPTLLINNAPQNGLMVSELGPGIYNVEIVDQIGCLFSIGNIEFEEPERYEIDLGDDRRVNFGEEIYIELNTNLPPEELDRINWLADGVMIDESTPDIVYIPLDNTTLSIEVLTQSGCLLVDEIFISVAPPSVYLPTAFYPGSNNAPNQTFGPFTLDGSVNTIISFQIYDRWGNRVFVVRDREVDDAGLFWDGTFRGRAAIEGVYIFKLVYENAFGNTVIESGEVTLLK